MEETVSGARVVRWPTLTFQKHMSYHIRYMALTFRQVNYPTISPPWDSWSALTFRCPNMVVLGGVSSTNILQPPKKSPNPWRHHGKFHNPLLQYNVAGEYYSYVLEYFSGPNMSIYMSISTQGLSKSMELKIGSTTWPLDRSLWSYLYIYV